MWRWQPVVHRSGKPRMLLLQKTIDLVLLDYDLGKERGFEFVIQARQSGFKGRFLMVTAGMSDAESVRALDLGVSGIFPKHSLPTVLIQAIRKVMARETWLDENAIQALVRESKHPQGARKTKGFTERESQVLRAVFEDSATRKLEHTLVSRRVR